MPRDRQKSRKASAEELSAEMKQTARTKLVSLVGTDERLKALILPVVDGLLDEFSRTLVETKEIAQLNGIESCVSIVRRRLELETAASAESIRTLKVVLDDLRGWAEASPAPLE